MGLSSYHAQPVFASCTPTINKKRLKSSLHHFCRYHCRYCIIAAAEEEKKEENENAAEKEGERKLV